MENDAKDFKKLFPIGQIPFVLAAIFKAGSNLKKETENDFEDRLTRRLFRRLTQISTFRDGPLGIYLKPEIVSPDMKADSHAASGEIDLLVSCGLGSEVYFPIEAKRLRVRYSNGVLDSGSNKYVMDGMMRFVTGQYAPLMKAGSMLGYVFDGNTDKARANIDKAIQNKAPELKLKGTKHLVQSKILSNNPVDETIHELEKGFFAIYHVFLAV